MTRIFSRAPGILLLAVVAACGPVVPQAPARGDLSAEIVQLDGAGPPKGPKGACWAKDTLPAVIETVTEQIADTPTPADATGKPAPASYRTVTQQKMVRDRAEVWFRAPCPQEMDVEFVATLQRALKARGYFKGALTGQPDRATGAAVRRYQAARGLDSAKLSLAAAKELGIVATALDELSRKDKGRRGTHTAAD